MEPQELGTVNSPKAQEGDLVNHFILFTSKSHRPAQCPPGNIYSFLEKCFGKWLLDVPGCRQEQSTIFGMVFRGCCIRNDTAS